MAGIPDRLSVLEPGLPSRLAAAFTAHHPWVESVERVEVVPPHRLCVRLRFRTPVLRVRPTEGPPVMVDAARRLAAGPAEGRLAGVHGRRSAGIQNSRGAGYGQTDVEAAARLAAYWRGLGDRWALQRLDLGPEGFTLTTAVGRVFWGHAPAAETAGEPTAAVKRERLLRRGRRRGWSRLAARGDAAVMIASPKPTDSRRWAGGQSLKPSSLPRIAVEGHVELAQQRHEHGRDGEAERSGDYQERQDRLGRLRPSPADQSTRSSPRRTPRRDTPNSPASKPTTAGRR